MTLPKRMKFGIFMAPFHPVGDNPTLALDRDLELIEWLEQLGYDEAWVGEHHSGGWEPIASPEVFISAAAQRTKRIKLGTGVISLPYHHPLMTANRMVLLDHMTKGRIMMGVGPGALVTDAYMLGIDFSTQRPKMDEALGIIIRLLTETDPITYEADWFKLREAKLHLRPYTQPYFPIAVAAAATPSGLVTAGKHGTSVLSLSVLASDAVKNTLKEFWKIAEDTAAEHGKSMNREDWRLVTHVFLAESKKEAIEQARIKAGQYQRGYFEEALGNPSLFDGPADRIVDAMIDKGAWCVGTPDDLIQYINRLDENSGGFGGLLIQATEWGTREQVFRSYELLARYVMPHFQGTMTSLSESYQWMVDTKDELQALRKRSLEKAHRDYTEKR
tara:strand:- start:8792 stop:9955 length:1164 start_codon:yes stop_codon:yes gene_type:complete